MSAAAYRRGSRLLSSEADAGRWGVSDRPILFSAPMVRAILAGKKTQTRRVLRDPRKRTPNGVELLTRWTNDDPRARVRVTDRGAVAVDTCGGVAAPILLSPYGAVGDRLWVRETWAFLTGNGRRVVYAADGEPLTGDGTQTVLGGMKWTPSIFMRRTESRLTLEVTDVRVERLQSIIDDDARAEGVEAIGARNDFRGAFCALWDSINAERAAWDSNPWVWVVSFQRREMGT